MKRLFLTAILLGNTVSFLPAQETGQSEPQAQSPSSAAVATRRRVVIPAKAHHRANENPVIALPNYPFVDFLDLFEKETGLKVEMAESLKPKTIHLESIPRKHLVSAFILWMELQGFTVQRVADTLNFNRAGDQKTSKIWDAPFSERFKRSLEAMKKSPEVEVPISISAEQGFMVVMLAEEISSLTKRAPVTGPGVLRTMTHPILEVKFKHRADFLEFLDERLQKCGICMYETGEHFIAFVRTGHGPGGRNIPVESSKGIDVSNPR